MRRPKITDFVNDCSKRHTEAYRKWREFNETAEMHIDAQKVGRRHLQDYRLHYIMYNGLSVCRKTQTFFQAFHVAASEGDADPMDGSLISRAFLIAFRRVGRLKMTTKMKHNCINLEEGGGVVHSYAPASITTDYTSSTGVQRQIPVTLAKTNVKHCNCQVSTDSRYLKLRYDMQSENRLLKFLTIIVLFNLTWCEDRFVATHEHDPRTCAVN